MTLMKQWRGNIASLARVVQPRTDITASPDPDDKVILGTAVAGHADMIVSGDVRYMLKLSEVEGIPIVSLSEALRTFGSA